MSERMFAGLAPTNTDVHENTPVSLATAWLAAVDGTVDGQVFHASVDPTGTYTAKLYQMATSDTEIGAGGTGTLLATKVYGPITADADNFVSYDTPIAFTAGTVMKEVLETSTGHYAATNDYFTSASHTEGDLTAPQDGSTAGGFTVFNGTFAGGAAYPVGHFRGTLYHISPVITPASADPSEGSAGFLLDLAPAAQGARTSTGAAALSLGMAPAATGARASAGTVAGGLSLGIDVDGERTSAGSAALDLGLAPAATGARSSSGSAALDLGLGVDADGARNSQGLAQLGLGLELAAIGVAVNPSEGSAAFSLNLALAATGAAEVSCLPFPWACSDLPAFPGTCSPVPSFSEVTP